MSGTGDVSKFSRVLPLSIRKELNSGRQEKKESVRVTLTYPTPACGALNPYKELDLRLTNDDNPGFFYHLRINEAEFPELKSQQGLLVDFYGFPNQLVTLLEKCDDESGAKFCLVMKIGALSTVLDIVESNPFKYLCHLSLQINPGTDGEIKKYLCDVTTALKSDLANIQDKYSHLSSQMQTENSKLKEQLDLKNQEIGELKETIHSQANNLSTKHFRDMTEEKEKLLRLQNELASKFESERSELERRHGMATQTLDDRINTLESENRELLQKKYQNETQIQDFSSKLKNSLSDLKLLQQEITAMRKQNEKLDADYHEKSRLNSSLSNKLNILEAELKEKSNNLQKSHEQILQLSELKTNLEDHATAMVKEVERVKNLNKMVSGELIKANEIIGKLQGDLRAINVKFKLQSQITTEQEKIIVDRDKAIDSLELKISNLENSLENEAKEVKELRKSEEESLAKIQELEKTIKSNESMISWLNKQLNEFQGLSNLSKFRQNLATSANATTTTTTPDAINDQNANYRKTASAQNSLQTPSWMHIYQSTSTPLDDDLSSRLEKVATNPGLGMNYRDLRSRFDNEKEEEKRPPTWARGRGGRVTLDIKGGRR